MYVSDCSLQVEDYDVGVHRAQQKFDVIYLFKPEGTEACPHPAWIYYRLKSGGDVSQDDGYVEISRVGFPHFDDLPNDPGGPADGTPARIGYESVELNLHAYLLNRLGVDHERSVLIGTLNSLLRRRA